jgi:hypothetical protein
MKEIPLLMMENIFGDSEGFAAWPVTFPLSKSSDMKNSCVNLGVEQVEGTWVVLECKSYLWLLNLPIKPERGDRPPQEQAVLKGKKIYRMKIPPI